MKVFPAADLFPMLPDDELQALADHIKANGLQSPIAIVTVDGEEMLVDGRNRLAACKIADVEPTFRKLNGEDLKAFVVGANINRRNITKGQKAMATAMIYPEPEKGGRRKNSKVTLEFSSMLLSKARTVLAYLPEQAKPVLAGASLDEAYEKALAAKQDTDSEGEKIERLKTHAPDLWDRVDNGSLTLLEASAILKARIEEAAAAEANKRETFLRVAETTFSGVNAFASDEFVSGLEKRLSEDEKFREAFLTRSRLANYDAARVPMGAKGMMRIMKALGKKGGGT